jgi:hypothetical protein
MPKHISNVLRTTLVISAAGIAVVGLLVIGAGLGGAAERGVLPVPRSVNTTLRTLSNPFGESDTAKALPDSVQESMLLFVLAGQSNMVGQGTIQPEDRRPIPGVWLFGNDYRWKPAHAPLDDPVGQVDPVSRDPVVGVGPGLFFAEHLRSVLPGRDIGVIPCAKGGSAMKEWAPDRSDATLYGSCLKRVRAASTVGIVAGLLFYQGETDALVPSATEKTVLPSRWRSSFATMVREWREDTGIPSLPVVFAQIGSHRSTSARFPNWKEVQRQQAAVSLPKVHMVRTEGLPLRDAVHLSREGCQTAGRRMANAWLRLRYEEQE